MSSVCCYGQRVGHDSPHHLRHHEHQAQHTRHRQLPPSSETRFQSNIINQLSSVRNARLQT